MWGEEGTPARVCARAARHKKLRKKMLALNGGQQPVWALKKRPLRSKVRQGYQTCHGLLLVSTLVLSPNRRKDTRKSFDVRTKWKQSTEIIINNLQTYVMYKKFQFDNTTYLEFFQISKLKKSKFICFHMWKSSSSLTYTKIEILSHNNTVVFTDTKTSF